MLQISQIMVLRLVTITELDGLMPPLVACHIVIHCCHALCCIGLVK